MAKHISNDMYRAAFFLARGSELISTEWNEEISRPVYTLLLPQGMEDASEILNEYSNPSGHTVNLRTYLNHLFDLKRDQSRYR